MNKILLLVVLSIELFASWNVDTNMPIKNPNIIIKDGIGLSKFKINSQIFGLNRWYFDGLSTSNRYDSNYIAHVSAAIDDVSVFDASLSPYLAEDPFFGFKFKDFTDSDDITYVLTDNHGVKIQQSFKIDRKDGLKNQKATIEQKRVKPITLNPKAWDAVTVDSAIEAVFSHYASRGTDEIEIPFDASTCFDKEWKPREGRELAGSGFCLAFYNLPRKVIINSKIGLRRIAIFSTTTPKPLLAFIQMPDNGFVDISMLFHLDKAGKLFYIGEGKDNKLYRSEILDMRFANYD